LKIVAKDVNVNIVIVAANCITGIAKGVRKEFSKYALLAYEPLMERFKEKKATVVEALREACDAIYPSTNLEVIGELCIGFLGNKSPVIRQQVALFLAKCFAMSTTTTLPKKTLKLYLPALLKNLNEADPLVRETSAEALGAILKSLGEKIFTQNAGEIEALKMDKVKEAADKCVLLNLKGEPRQKGGSTATTTDKVQSEQPSKPVTIKGGGGGVGIPAKKPASAPSKTSEPKKDVKKPTTTKTTENKKPTVVEEHDMSPDAVEEKALELFGAEIINGLSNANWKERLTAVESLANCIKRMPSDEVPCQIIVRTLAKKPGFKDPHFQVLKQRLELVATVASPENKFTQRSASYCVLEIADKIGDMKAGVQAKDALLKISDHCQLSYVVNQIFPEIFDKSKNPKNQENTLLWLSSALPEFGYTDMNTKFLLTYLKSSLQNSNASVRLASIQLVSIIYMYLGGNFRSMFDQEKPALLEQIDAEIEKVKSQGSPPVPTRGSAAKSSKTHQNNDVNDENGDNDEETGADEDPIKRQQREEAHLVRTDISSHFTDEFFNQLNDKIWKERQAALEKLEQLLRDNKFIEPQLGELPVNLNKRLTDTNKILATTSLRICEKLASALGLQGKRFVSSLAPGMIQALSDNKDTLRKAAISALNAFCDNCGGLIPFLENDLLAESFSTATNPNIKSELCGWLAQVLPKSKRGKLPAAELKAIVPSVYNFLEDRNPDVRTKAQELIMPLMIHVGPNEMLKVMNKAKPTSINIIQPFVEKARAEVAAKEPAPEAKASTIVQRPATANNNQKKKPVKSLYDTDSDDNVETIVAKKVDPLPKSAASTKGKEDKKTAVAPPVAPPKKKGIEDEDTSPPIQISLKSKRIEDDRNLKTLKWNFDVPRKEFVEQLKTQMETAAFNRTLLTQLFHDDFKHQLKAIDTLHKCVDELPDATLSNLDLILRWLTLRFAETNPTVILKLIEYMQSLFNMLLNVKNYHLIDYEAAAFIPYFIQKLGDPKDPIRKGFRQIIKQISQVYSPVKVFNNLIQALVSKNSRLRTECLEECGQMIELIGLAPFSPQTTLKEIAKQISDRDTGVRNAALNTITIAYQIVGEQVYKYCGKLNDKDQSMLDERIKRSSKTNASQVKASASGNSISSGGGGGHSHQIPNSTSLNTMTNNNTNGHHLERPSSVTSLNSNESKSRYGLQTPKKPSNGDVNHNHHNHPHHHHSTDTIVKPTKEKSRFRLELNDDDDDDTIDPVVKPKLLSHSGLDDLMNEPIKSIASSRKNHAITIHNINKDTNEQHEAIDLVITHISHQNIEISYQNLAQIDIVIKDKNKRELLVQHLDNLLNTCSVKLNVAQFYLNSLDNEVNQVFSLFKAVFNVIVNVFEFGLGKSTSIKTLKDLIYNLLCLMTESKISSYPDGEQLIKAVNMVTLKILELSNQTTSYCALIKLLSDSCAQLKHFQQPSSGKYLELVMKCIWRQIRRLSAVPNGTNQINNEIGTDKVLTEIHLFLTLYPSSSWQSKNGDLPLRTVKTLLYHLAKAKQATILDDLASINVGDDSELSIYIHKLFKGGFQLNNSNSGIPSSNSANAIATSKQQQQQQQQNTSPKMARNGEKSPDKLAKFDKKLVSSIIAKIGEPSTSKEGLVELYELKKVHGLDLDCFFQDKNSKLYCYIKENLEKIENQRPSVSIIPNNREQVDEIIRPLQTSASSSSTLSSFATQQKTKIELENQQRTDNPLHQLNNNNTSNSNTNGNSIDDLQKTIANYRSRMTNLERDSTNNSNLSRPTPNVTVKGIENAMKAEKYMEFAENLKKKYTRSKTEVCLTKI
jgi:cytoskeleton-associated protein 5